MTSAKCLRKDTAKVEGLVADVPQSSHFSQQEDSSVPFWVREWGITNVYERTGKSSRCPSFLAGESVKDGQKHGNIKQHTPTNRPNKKDLGSLLKKWEHADVIPPTPTIWSRAPDPGYGLSWKARILAKCSARLDRIWFWLFGESRDTTKPMWMSSSDVQRIHSCLKR